MKRVRRSSRDDVAMDALERDLESRIRSIRAEYAVKEVVGSVMEEEISKSDNDKIGDARRIPLSMQLIGPRLTGTHLVASANLVRLIELQAIAEARGSCQSLAINQQEDALSWQWQVREGWEKPNVWLRQGKTGIEADAASLNHWSRSLLTPESRAIMADLVVVHPTRNATQTDVDDIFVSEFQSIFELCGFGLLPLRPSWNLSYVVVPNDWDATARNIGAALQGWATLNHVRTAVLGEDRPPIAVLLVWPREAWVNVKSALAAAAEVLPLSQKVAVHVVSEEVVLSNRHRKSKLIGHSSGLYAMLVKGSAVLIADRQSSAAPMVGDHGGTNGTTQSTSVTPKKRIHVAVALSEDSRWLCFAWCTSRGESLSVRSVALEDETLLKGDGTEYRQSLQQQVLQSLHDISSSIHEPDIVLGLTADVSRNFFDIETLREKFTVWIRETTEDNVAVPDTIRVELDDLAFLSTALENPSKGEESTVLLGALRPRTVDGLHRVYHKPIHMRCAKLLALYLDGLVPDL